MKDSPDNTSQDTIQELEQLRRENKRLQKQLHRAENNMRQMEETRDKHQALLSRIDEAHQVMKQNQELEIRNASLSRMNTLKDEFLANSSHELRTPLHGIIGIAESLMDGLGGELNQEQKSNISIIVQSARRLAFLVNDILDYSRMKHQALQMNLRPTDINSTVKLATAIAQPLLGDKPVSLVYECPEHIPAVLADEDRLQQILLNLIGNAVKFTIEGEIKIRIKETGNFVEFEVRDTGPGIAQEKLGPIFDSYEQIGEDVHNKAGGTGLGLSITRKLVELHGGQIKVESKLGVGSVFSFQLPQSDAQPQNTENDKRLNVLLGDAPALEQEANPTKTHALFRKNEQSETKVYGYTVLIVDDEPINLQVLKNQLSLYNFKIITAQDGYEALKKLGEVTPDVALVDLMMPRINGYDLCRKIRTRYSISQLPIIILSARNQQQDLVRALKSGANDYLSKPFHKEELLSRIMTHLKLKNIHSDLERNVKRRTSELEKKNKELKSFAYSISHDLRAPLRRIKGFIKIMVEEYGHLIEKEGSDLLTRITGNTERMEDLIDDLLSLSHVTRCKTTLTEVNLSDITRDIAASLQSNQPDRPAEFIIHEEVNAQCDGRLIRVALENLLGNSWKYTSRKEHTRIEFGANVTESGCIYYIKDNGTGFDMAKSSQLFGVFQRLHRNDEFEGTGIGLATVSRVIERHNGKIWAEAAVEEGATFYFTLNAN